MIKIKKLIKNIILIILLLSCILFILNKSSTKSNKFSTEINTNEVPYISTYYIKPIVNTKEDVTIDFYITDYSNKNYVFDNDSDNFTVTIKVAGKKDIVKKNLKAGDHSISIGKFNKQGEQNFSILCTDSYNRNSHELFNSFLVRDNLIINEYIMTKQDLNTYKIDNTNNTSSTREGLQKLLDDKKNQGYNKVSLLPGIYTIDHTSPIFIPSEFTLDLNQATIKLSGFTGDKATMIDLNNTFDSHVVNGTIEGDFYEHDYTNSPNNSEWVNGIRISGESKYSSFENLTVKDITGYGGTNGIANSRDESLGYTYLQPIPIGDTFKLGDIDRTTGEIINTTNRTTSDYINIEDYANIGYLTVSKYLGYQGNPCGTWNLIFHFYDDSQEFIQSTDGYQYRKVSVPKNAKYMKVTILNEDYPTDLSVQLFRIPTHCAFKNIIFENCRAVGLAQEAMKDMLVENCTFTNSGQALAKCAYDAEDGWDMMQDVTFRGLNFYNNPNNDFLTAAGHNFTIENSNMSIYIWGRTRNVVIKNNTIKGSRIHNDGLVKSGVPRFINNKVTQALTFANTQDTKYYSVVKYSEFSSVLLNGIANNCSFNIPEGYLENTIFNNCDIKNVGVYINDKVYFNNCTFSSDKDKISSLKFNQQDGDRIFNKCIFNNSTKLEGNYFNKAIFNTCTFDDVNIFANSKNKSNDIQFNNCDISYHDNPLLTISSDVNLTFNNCAINDKSSTPNENPSLVWLKQEPNNGTTKFKDCKILKSNGYILDGYYNPGQINDKSNYTIILDKSNIDVPYFSDKYLNNTYYKVIDK